MLHMPTLLLRLVLKRQSLQGPELFLGCVIYEDVILINHLVLPSGLFHPCFPSPCIASKLGLKAAWPE